jgi:hypothetical protein
VFDPGLLTQPLHASACLRPSGANIPGGFLQTIAGGNKTSEAQSLGGGGTGHRIHITCPEWGGVCSLSLLVTLIDPSSFGKSLFNS